MLVSWPRKGFRFDDADLSVAVVHIRRLRQRRADHAEDDSETHEGWDRSVGIAMWLARQGYYRVVEAPR